MAEKGGVENPRPAGNLHNTWHQVLAAIDDRILRACLPKNAQAVMIEEDHVIITVDSEFKKEYCQRKQSDLEAAIDQIIGPRSVVIGEPPLIEQAHAVAVSHHSGINARIAVLGIGDGGVNAVDRMHQEHLQGVKLVALDTDKQVLGISQAHETVQLGLDITGGRGTGGDEEKGQKAALESRWEIASLIKGADLVFITAGLGGGTGTGAAPIVAEIAKENEALTIGVVTKPFSFEGSVRRTRAENGVARLRPVVDVLIVISNDRLLETATRGISITRAFELADKILHQGVQGISDLITVRGLVNLDFADIRNVLSNAGDAMMGMGESRGEHRAIDAAKLASSNPLLEGGSIQGARKMIMNVTGGENLTLSEVTAAADLIRRVAATECDLVFGAVIQEDMRDTIKITLIAADFHKGIEMARRKERSLVRKRIVLGEDLDVPTFLRRERASDASTSSARAQKTNNKGSLPRRTIE